MFFKCQIEIISRPYAQIYYSSLKKKKNMINYHETCSSNGGGGANLLNQNLSSCYKYNKKSTLKIGQKLFY